MSSVVSVYDTIIVGAGASGITAGYELIRRTGTSNNNVRILEASSVWGGRVRKLDDSFGGFPIDIGGGWIHENGEGYPNAVVLDSIVNNPLVAVTGKTAADDRPFLSYEDGEAPIESPPQGDGGSDVFDEIFIDFTWYDFFATYIYPTVRDSITYNCPVSLIDYSEDDLVYLECENGEAMQAKSVIVTASVEVLRTGVITFNPSLPDNYITILEDYPFTTVLKGFMTFSEAFYETGKSFSIYPPFYGDFNGGTLFWDASYLQPTSTNVLGVLITDRYLVDVDGMTDEQILSELLNQLDQVFGGSATANYLNHTFKDWRKEPYILGGWTNANDTDEYQSDVLTLLKPLGNGQVYLAGEAIPHDGWSSTVPAAALSGQNAACRVLGGDFEIDSGCTFPEIDMPSSSPGGTPATSAPVLASAGVRTGFPMALCALLFLHAWRF